MELCSSYDHLITADSFCATTPLGHNSHTAGTISHQLPTKQALVTLTGGSLRADTWRKRKIGQVTPSTRARPTTSLELRLNFLVLRNDHHPIGPSTLQQNQIACVFIAAAIGLLQITLTPSLPPSIGLLQAYSGVWRLQNLMETWADS